MGFASGVLAYILVGQTVRQGGMSVSTVARSYNIPAPPMESSVEDVISPICQLLSELNLESKGMRLGLIQMDSKVGEIDRNVSAAMGMIDQAAGDGSTMILLPEYWSTGFFPGLRDYKLYDLAATDDGLAMSAIKEKARAHHIHIVASIYERDGSDLYYDTSILVDGEGRIIGKYRKTHIGGERYVVIDGKLVTDLGIESIYFRTGSRYPVFTVGEWKVGIMLCYDTYFPESARCLALAGAELILAPFGISDTNKTIWKELLATRSFENMLYIAAANNVGYVPTVDIDMVLGGRSIVFDPLGERIAEASYDKEEVLSVDLDRDQVFYARRLHLMFRDRRPETYGIISTPTDEIDRGA